MKMNINNAYEPLVERFIAVDNYEKMKTILDVGFSGLEVIEKYYEKQQKEFDICENNNEVLLLQEKIKNMQLVLDETQFKFMEEKEKIHTSYQEKMNKLREETEKSFIELQKEYFDYKNKSTDILLEEKNKESEKLQNAIKEFNKKLEIQREDKQQEINTLRDTLTQQQTMFNDILRSEKEKIIEEKQKIIDELEEQNQTYRNKYEVMEVKSVIKGKPYEDAIEIQLEEIFENEKNSFSIERFTSKAGKGDFLITNNYSGIRIMMEVKNMPSVSSKVKEQQPKFLRDVCDKVNKYDGGLMVASGKIEGRKNYQFEVLDNGKVICFIENYMLKCPENIVMILQTMHEKIKDVKSVNTVSRENMFKVQMRLYKMADQSLKKSKNAYEIQKELVNEIKMKILELFDVDVVDYLDDKNKAEQTMSQSIKDKVDKYVSDKINETPDIKLNKLKQDVNNEFKEYIELYKKDKKNGISKNIITNILKKYFTEKTKSIKT
jgi:hypothetical protein